MTGGVTDGDDIRGFQLTGCSKHSVCVSDDGDKAGGADDGAVGAAGGDGSLTQDVVTGSLTHRRPGKY